jgi:hypothetical protein
VLEDHPDPLADAALGALGGERCPCLDVLDAWRVDRERIPVDETAEPLSWDAHLDRHLALRSRRARMGTGGGVAGPSPARDRLLARLSDEISTEVLRCLPPPLFDLMVTTRAVHASRRGGDAPTGWSVLDATAHRVRRCVETWLGPHAPTTVQVSWSRTGPTCAVDDLFEHHGGSLHLGLPPTWLVEVWARGLAVVDEHLVLGVEAIERGDRLVVTACELEEGDGGRRPLIRRATAHRHDRSWHLDPSAPDRPRPAQSGAQDTALPGTGNLGSMSSPSRHRTENHSGSGS